MVREEGGGGRARRAVDCAVDAPLDARFGVPRGMCRWVWMVVRFVCLCVIRVPVCARVSRVCPDSPRCLFTGTTRRKLQPPGRAHGRAYESGP